MNKIITLCVGLGALVACGGADRAVVLQDKGSDTMVNLMQRLSEEHQKGHPKLVVAVTGGGTGTGIKAIIDGTTDLANASREMKEEERALAQKNGVTVHETVVGHDGLAIVVNKKNPLTTLSFEELKCIFAADGACDEWADLGVTMDCGGDDLIVKVGRQNNSGTYEYFRDEVLGIAGKFTSTMDQSGTQQVIDVVGTTTCAVGYGGMGYHSENTKFVCLSREKGAPCTEPTIENVKNRTYAFGRPLYVYTNGAPTGASKEFLDWVEGPDGQKIVLESGFVPK